MEKITKKLLRMIKTLLTKKITHNIIHCTTIDGSCSVVKIDYFNKISISCFFIGLLLGIIL